jgi:small subunit ribosomal protein S16
MSVKIRMARGGARNRPFFRVVVAESSAPRDGRFIEKLGTYNPLLPKEHPQRLILNMERIKYWISKGATPSDRIARFLGAANVLPMPKIHAQTTKDKPRAKTVEKLKAKDEARVAAADAAAKRAAEAAAAPEPEKPAEPPAESAGEAASTPEPEKLAEPPAESAGEGAGENAGDQPAAS